MRIILYTGKGGVGKTTIAAATACKIAREGKTVLVMSTDQAHSLSDSMNVRLGKEPVKIQENLYGLEVDTIYEGEKSWGNLKSYMREMLTLKGKDGIEVEELLVFPGLEELFSMFKIMEMAEGGVYDVIIVDCAPTGETLSLLKYPEKFSGMLEKMLPIKRKSVKVAGPAVEKIMKIPMPEESVFDDIEYLMDKMEKLQTLMLNHDVVSMRIVTTPEKIVIQETKRNFTCLHLFNYNVDAIIINRIYSKEAMEGYFQKWVNMQVEGLQEINESFSEVPKFYFELQKGEICSLDDLQRTGEMIFHEQDPSEILFREEIYKVSLHGKEKTLTILLPFADKGELELKQSGRELVLGVKNEVRRFPLPVTLQESEIKGAKYEAPYLTIRF